MDIRITIQAILEEIRLYLHNKFASYELPWGMSRVPTINHDEKDGHIGMHIQVL